MARWTEHDELIFDLYGLTPEPKGGIAMNENQKEWKKIDATIAEEKRIERMLKAKEAKDSSKITSCEFRVPGGGMYFICCIHPDRKHGKSHREGWIYSDCINTRCPVIKFE